MRPILSTIIGDPNRSTLESRIYNALTFITVLASICVLPLVFVIDLGVLHVMAVLACCFACFFLYYLSRFRKVRSELFLIMAGLVLLTIIWIAGYGSIGYVFLFYQFIMLYSLLALERRVRMAFFLMIPALILILTALEYFGVTTPRDYDTPGKRSVDFMINFTVWFLATGFIIKVIIDNFRMERRRLEYELSVAQKLQRRLLPPPVPKITGYSLHALYLPMAKVGGDFYDYRVSDNAIDILIADVSGHGMPSAFLATITKIAFDHERSRGRPAEVLARMNEVVLNATVESNFVTVLFCTIDRASMVMRCASAGHLPALLYRRAGGVVEAVRGRGKPLGWFDDPGIDEIEVHLFEGDRLVLYTDGIIECSDGRGGLFGTSALTEAITDGADKSAREFSDSLVANLRDFSRADFFEDDVTMVVLDVG